MFRIMRIQGESLAPDWRTGDFVVVGTAPWWRRGLRPGQVIAFHHPEHGLLLKRVVRVLPGGDLWVEGSHPHSVDSRRFGPVPPQAVLGRVLWHIRAPHSPS